MYSCLVSTSVRSLLINCKCFSTPPLGSTIGLPPHDRTIIIISSLWPPLGPTGDTLTADRHSVHQTGDSARRTAPQQTGSVVICYVTFTVKSCSVWWEKNTHKGSYSSSAGGEYKTHLGRFKESDAAIIPTRVKIPQSGHMRHFKVWKPGCVSAPEPI